MQSVCENHLDACNRCIGAGRTVLIIKIWSTDICRYDWAAKKNLRAGYFLWSMVAYGSGKKLYRSNSIYIAFACCFKTRPSPS